MEQTENMTNQLEEAYLQKRIKNRKISLLVVSIVTLALALAIIIMACVNVDLRPRFVTNPDKVVIYTTEVPSGFISLDESSDEYANFQKVYNDMFQINTLSAVFSGNFGNYAIEETLNEITETDTALRDLVGSNNYVKLVFDTPQKFYYKNGSDYVSIYREDYSLTFDCVYFAFDNENVTKDLTFYFAVEGNLGTNNNGVKKRSITKVTVQANSYSIYESLNSFRDLAE